MIVAYFGNNKQLIVYARKEDFVEEHAWRWEALKELASHYYDNAWADHTRFRFAIEVELAVMLVLQPCLHKGKDKIGSPWILPSKNLAEETLKTGRYPEPKPFFIVPPGNNITNDAISQKRDEIEAVDDAVLLENGEEYDIK